jgi:hypothetical protein
MQNYTFDHPGRIIAISDIHSDLDALIIQLRDCAGIIALDEDLPQNFDYRTSFANVNISDGIPDQVAIHLPNGEVREAPYRDSMGFRWIGGNTCVVIVGDIIDGGRNGAIRLEYNNEDVKILRFLNAICENAILAGGKIIKLLGNHEWFNIFVNDEIIESCNTATALAVSYLGVDRKNLFSVDNTAYTLLGNANYNNVYAIIARINDYIFVHAGFSQTMTLKINELFQIIEPDPIGRRMFDNIDEFINMINNYTTRRITKSEPLPYDNVLKNIVQSGEHTLLQTRKLGYPTDIDLSIRQYMTRNPANLEYSRGSSICKILAESMNRVCVDCEQFKLVIGHCIQFDSTIKNKYNSTYNYTYRQGNKQISTSLNPNSTNVADHLYYGRSDSSAGAPKVFGMTLDCYNNGQQHNTRLNGFKLYRLDTGSSRGFDNLSLFNVINNVYVSIPISQLDLTNAINRERLKESLIKIFLSRSPSILEITADDVKIIRSSLSNTIEWQKRIIFNEITPENLPIFNEIVHNIDNSFPEVPPHALEAVSIDVPMDAPVVLGGSYKINYYNKYKKYIQKIQKLQYNNDH